MRAEVVFDFNVSDKIRIKDDELRIMNNKDTEKDKIKCLSSHHHWLRKQEIRR